MALIGVEETEPKSETFKLALFATEKAWLKFCIIDIWLVKRIPRDKTQIKEQSETKWNRNIQGWFQRAKAI